MQRFAIKAQICAGLLAGITMLSPAAHAQSATGSAGDNFSNSFLTRKTLSGDWDGGRAKLQDAGITIKGVYVGEFADIAAGGMRQGNGYAQQIGISASADLGKIMGLDGGVLHLSFNQRQGRNASADFAGNRLAVQEVYGAGETLRITEFSYEQTFDARRLNTKLGFYPMGNDFALTPLGCDFQNVGFCSHPQNLPAASGWSDYPTGKWGGRIKVTPASDVYIEAGAYDVNPGYYEKANGLKISLSGSTGVLVPVEVAYTAALGAAKLPGHYKAGAYYDTSDAADAATARESDDGRYGFYLLADQMIASFDGDPKRGLIAMAQASWSDPRTAVFQGTLLGGLIAQGPFAARPADYVDIGYVRAILNRRTAQAKQAASHGTLTDLSTGEGVLELGYGFQAAPWLQIHPNVQYIMNPGTFSYKHYANAWAIGLQVKASL